MLWQVKCRWGLLPVGGACMTSHGQVLMTLVVWYKVPRAVAHSRGVITKPEAQTTYPKAAVQLPEAPCHQFRNSNPYKVIKFFVLWWKRYKYPQSANTYTLNLWGKCVKNKHSRTRSLKIKTTLSNVQFWLIRTVNIDTVDAISSDKKSQEWTETGLNSGYTLDWWLKQKQMMRAGFKNQYLWVLQTNNSRQPYQQEE